MRSIIAIGAAVLLAGCASNSTDIRASYVSPILYQNLSCSQLALEAQNVSSRAVAASGQQDKKAGQDAVAVGVALVLFWPAAFLAQGDGATAAEVARLKGEMEAIEHASIRNNCGIVFEKAPATSKSSKPPAPGSLN